MVVATLVALTAALVGLSQSTPLSARAVTGLSNADTSLTLLYQNNLNASDDKNHVGALLLDAVPRSKAVSACASFGEKVLPKSTVQKYKTDFARALLYQDFAEYLKADDGFYIDNGVVTVDDSLEFAPAPANDRKLPVLCTQSANNGAYNAPVVNGTLITVTSGGNNFVGYRNQKSFRFSGIPYADTPKRWKYSSIYSKKGQTIQATAYGPQCAQGNSGSEDCLFLNIQTPYIPKSGSKKNLRPVLFWIHGGGFTGGTGADPVSDGGNLASKEDIVVVEINYRLSTLGFLAIPGTEIRGNYGIADQIVALDWTIANIAAFGGDPKQITIIGGSAGAGSVRVLTGSPQAIGKFQGAVQVSNLGGGVTLGLKGDYGTTYSTYYTIDQSYNVAGTQIFSGANCTNADMKAQIACLEKVPALQLVNLPTVARYVVQDGKYVNTGNLIVSTRNASTAHIPVILGVTRDDGASFSTYPTTPVANLSQGLQVGLKINSTWAQKIIDSKLFPMYDSGNLTLDTFNVSQRIATDKTFRCIDQATVYAGSQTGAFEKSYFYQFERTAGGYDPNGVGGPKDNNPNNPYFRLHGAEVSFIFGTLNRIRDANDLYTEQVVTSYFASFAKTGNPNPDPEYLRVRGYDKVADAIRKTGSWGIVTGSRGEIRMFDYPGKRNGFVDVEQCAWLGYPLDYYLKGGI